MDGVLSTSPGAAPAAAAATTAAVSTASSAPAYPSTSAMLSHIVNEDCIDMDASLHQHLHYEDTATTCSSSPPDTAAAVVTSTASRPDIVPANTDGSTQIIHPDHNRVCSSASISPNSFSGEVVSDSEEDPTVPRATPTISSAGAADRIPIGAPDTLQQEQPNTQCQSGINPSGLNSTAVAPTRSASTSVLEHLQNRHEPDASQQLDARFSTLAFGSTPDPRLDGSLSRIPEQESHPLTSTEALQSSLGNNIPTTIGSGTVDAGSEATTKAHIAFRLSGDHWARRRVVSPQSFQPRTLPSASDAAYVTDAMHFTTNPAALDTIISLQHVRSNLRSRPNHVSGLSGIDDDAGDAATEELSEQSHIMSDTIISSPSQRLQAYEFDRSPVEADRVHFHPVSNTIAENEDTKNVSMAHTSTVAPGHSRRNTPASYSASEAPAAVVSRSDKSPHKNPQLVVATPSIAGSIEDSIHMVEEDDSEVPFGAGLVKGRSWSIGSDPDRLVTLESPHSSPILDRFDLLVTRNGHRNVAVWFSGITKGTNWMDELAFTHLCASIAPGTQQHDILDMFDIFDVSGCGILRFEELYIIIALFVAHECFRGADFIEWFGDSVFNVLSTDHTQCDTLSVAEIRTFTRLYGVSDVVVWRRLQSILRSQHGAEYTGVVEYRLSSTEFTLLLEQLFAEWDAWRRSAHLDSVSSDEHIEDDLAVMYGLHSNVSPVRSVSSPLAANHALRMHESNESHSSLYSHSEFQVPSTVHGSNQRASASGEAPTSCCVLM
jgi:hypothetical protein